MPEFDKRSQNRGERRKPILILAVIGIILLGVFLIILLFFHSYLSSRGPSKALSCPDPPTLAVSALPIFSVDSTAIRVGQKSVTFRLRQV